MIRALALSTFVGLAFSSLPCIAADVKKADEPLPSGNWEGMLELTSAVRLRVTFDLSKTPDGKWTGTWKSPDQSPKSMPLKTVTFTDGALDLVTAIGASYQGKFDAKSGNIRGTWKQSGQSWPLELKRFDPAKAAAPAIPKELAGLWEGKLKIEGTIELRLVLRVENGSDGKLTALLASPDQGANDIPITQIGLKDGELTFESRSIAAKYKGKRNAAGTAFEGTFEQAGLKIPLNLSKTDKVSEVVRPQTPKPPFPYRTEEVSYENRAGGVKLAGTLSLPTASSPVPAVLLITGSGAQDRDETILGHKPFLVLADHLTRRGIAVLRVDDRGVGGSTGSVNDSTTLDFALDALAGVDFLKSRKEIDPKRIGLIGHSEGGIVAPVAAARSKDIAYIVLMAGTGVTGAEILVAQADLILKANGASEAERTLNRELQQKTFAVLDQEKDSKAAITKLAAAFKERLAKRPEAEKKSDSESDEVLYTANLQRVTTPWFRYFLSYDPRTALRQVQCPVLALNGEKDLQVPPRENLAEIKKALHSAGNDRVKTVELPGLNHLFQPCKTGSPSEYASIETTIAPEALKTITDWLFAQTAGQKSS